MPELTADAHIADFADFITASPSSYHAAAEVARRLEAAGYEVLDESAEWPTAAGGYVVVRDGAVIAWSQPQGARASTPVRVLGAHTDSPSFKVKPTPDTTTAGIAQIGVEVYGGPLLNSWLDRELAAAGRIVTRDGTVHLVHSTALLRIPQLAVHLDREANSGLALDKQRHTQPIWAMGDGDLLDALATTVGASSSDVVGHDLMLVDTNPPARFGRDDVFFAAGRMDNLSSVHAGLTALLGAPNDADHISVLAAFDHEELGSGSRSGAGGPLLEDVLVRVWEGLGATPAQQRRAANDSWILSADAGHAVHPNYPEKHDPVVRPELGCGTLLKLNANQKYATDAVGAARWHAACDAAGVETQPFVSNNTIRCGSTIGPISATRLGIRTIDVGVPLLSMHSARELAHIDDLVGLARAVGAFFAGA